MQFPEVVASLARGSGVTHAQAAIRAAHGRGAARWLAQEQGISQRTARRWLSGSYPRSRASAIVDTAGGLGAAALAAQRLAGASTIVVGKVQVSYRGDNRNEGARRIGRVPVRGIAAEHLGDAVKDLLGGQPQRAADAFSDAVISGYDDGLEEALSISEYSDGVELEQ